MSCSLGSTISRVSFLAGLVAGKEASSTRDDSKVGGDERMESLWELIKMYLSMHFAGRFRQRLFIPQEIGL